MSRVIKIDCKKLENKLLLQFYELVGNELGFDISDENIRYDCRKIEIAENIQDSIYSAYKSVYPEAFEKDYSGAVTEVAMILALSGPKVNKKLNDNMVKVEEDFITFEK